MLRPGETVLTPESLKVGKNKELAKLIFQGKDAMKNMSSYQVNQKGILVQKNNIDKMEGSKTNQVVKEMKIMNNRLVNVETAIKQGKLVRTENAIEHEFKPFKIKGNDLEAQRKKSRKKAIKGY